VSLPDWVTFWADILGLAGGLVSATVAIVWFAVRHTRVARAEFEAFCDDHGRVHDTIERRLAAGDKHFTMLGHDLEHADISEIRNDLAEMKAAMRENAALQHARDERVGRIEQQLVGRIEKQLDEIRSFLLKSSA
jgi:hypothetical protein